MKRSNTLPFSLSLLAVGVVACFCGAASDAFAKTAATGLQGNRLPGLFVVPFVGLLLTIAVLPLAAGHWWERHANKAKVAFLFSLPLVVLLIFHFGQDGLHALADNAAEYVSFMTLLGSLFVISGGIYVGGSLAGTPLVNTAMLALGSILANVIGTTGASMVLVRPLIRANERRRRVAHVVIFFIFIVSNCGGLLTPLGDPPLLLGYLAGVPFEWTLRLLPHWVVVNGLLLVIFNVLDQMMLVRDERSRTDDLLREVIEHEPICVRGLHNVAFLLGIVAIIVVAGCGLGNGGLRWPFGAAEGLMLALAAGSFYLTNREIREKNRFTFGPLIEVAVLFAGIFVTMTPALLILNAYGPFMGLHKPWQLFWASGMLSSVLDNAPTYLAVLAMTCGDLGIPLHGPYVGRLIDHSAGSGQTALAAISCGCVFMGALTYIGNGPNLMVKAIAEEGNIRMPSFFGYLAYSLPVLIPVFGLATILFFRS